MVRSRSGVFIAGYVREGLLQYVMWACHMAGNLDLYKIMADKEISTWKYVWVKELIIDIVKELIIDIV